MKNEQVELAKKFGYAESAARHNRGDLVPYDHRDSSLSREQVLELKSQGFHVGRANNY